MPGLQQHHIHALQTAVTVVFAAAVSALALLAGGCAGEAPDTSAPERTVIDRSPDWQGALLYIADENGPEPEWGSVRIYDNVSSFVEKTVEQTAAAAPVDIYVTRDGGSMYVAGANNGRIDKFRWDGNNWIRGGVTIETPAQQATALAPGPDGKLYLTTAGGGGPAGGIYRINIATDRVEDDQLMIPELPDLHGIAWSPDGSTVYLTGKSASGSPRLVAAAWPSLAVKSRIDLPNTASANRLTVSADGRFIYVMAAGYIYRLDPVSMAIVNTLAPSGKTETVYSGSALSADGRFMFVAGKTAGEDSSLYILDLTNDSVVKTVKHISDTAGGIQRVE
jgi:DNA-binding beta-propeller fold protein YncE